MKFERAADGCVHRARTGSAIRYGREGRPGLPTLGALARAARKDGRVRRLVDLAESVATLRRDGMASDDVVGLVALLASCEPGDDASTWLAAAHEFQRLINAFPTIEKEQAA